MPNNVPLAPQPQAAPLVCSGTPRQRDPAVFSGLGDSDVEDWVASYERVSTDNRWDDAMKLNNVIFYLADIANLWFRNHDADIATWSTFKTSFTEVFGRPGVRKLRAEQRLRERAQQPDETFTSYIEDVVDLCKRVNSDMTEADKIQTIMKGIDEDAFQMLLAKQPATMASVISLCQSYEELRKQRVLTRRTVQPADVLSADVETAGGQQLSCLSLTSATSPPLHICMTVSSIVAIACPTVENGSSSSLANYELKSAPLSMPTLRLLMLVF
ncbi:uncharacterized protein LOC144098012 [Amblyomma americanum]